VVGDFNAWDRSATPMRRDPQTGDWTVDLPLSAGRYTYAFVVDGGRFIPDPAAPLAPADDFGQRNSVVLVAASYRPIPPR
ncbi:MAG: glycoside hydrolase family 13, partial [Gemmatimonadetes bacterium]|nr:glycoside hydrolase family 13 [Gemmatimonadota bacterium]